MSRDRRRERWSVISVLGWTRSAYLLGGSNRGMLTLVRGRSGEWQQPAGIVACDFFTVENVFLRYYALFFISHGSRRVWLAACRKNPIGSWVTQQARDRTARRRARLAFKLWIAHT
jgi:hypothetical protein